MIVDEVDDTRTTLQYAVQELEKDVSEVAKKAGRENEKTNFFIFVLHVSRSYILPYTGRYGASGGILIWWGYGRTRIRRRGVSSHRRCWIREDILLRRRLVMSGAVIHGRQRKYPGHACLCILSYINIYGRDIDEHDRLAAEATASGRQ